MKRKSSEILDLLRSNKGKLSSVALAEMLSMDGGPGLSESSMLIFFKQAFPEIPLTVLREAGLWHKVSGGGKSDEWLNEILEPWLGSKGDLAPG